jgi:5-(carboxyamino)imidazole ribonucleotide synthase
MFAIAARRMGYRVHTYSPDFDTPTGQVSDLEVQADYDDLDRVRDFAQGVQVVTFEFENVPAPTAAAAADCAPVRPAGSVLHTTQHRLREKRFLRGAGLPVTEFEEVNSLDELRCAIEKQGLPGILKSADFGYDGKGQYRIDKASQAEEAWLKVNAKQAVLEKLVDFDCEVSVVAARSENGDFVHYPVVRNEHQRGILDVSISPANVPDRTAKDAVEIARAVLDKLEVVGVLCTEFFVKRDGSVLINELAPRPHNSGHLTFDACVTSQFEQQLRAVCSLPLGSTELLCPAAMANLLGDLWSEREPRWSKALETDRVKLHLYGKLEARPGRKMGHLTALGQDAEQTVRRARSLLTAD